MDRMKEGMSDAHPDEIGFGGLRLIQGTGFRYGVDAVLLAAFAAGETGGKGTPKKTKPVRICDLGCGNGIVSLVLTHKIPDSRITGVEVRQSEAKRAAENAALNQLSDRFKVICSDVLDLAISNPDASTEENETSSKNSSVMASSFDAVVMNPPYFRRGGAILNAASDKYIARHETTATLEDFLRVAVQLLPKGGDLFMVHRPDRLVDICTVMRALDLEPKELQMVVPYPGERPNILLIHGIRGAGPELRVLPEICVRNAEGDYTKTIHRLYERIQGDEDVPDAGV